MPSQKPLINFVVGPELLEAVEDFRFEHRFSSRAAAIKWLLAAALHDGPLPDLNNRGADDKYVPKKSKGSRSRG